MGQRPRSFQLHVDGGSRGNPGPAAAGVILRSADDQTVLFQGGFFLGRATNNVAEYHALLEGLGRARRLGAEQLEVRSDSELLVRQMNGEYRVRSQDLRELFERAQRLCRSFRRCSVVHIRRQDNADADRLVNQAINLGRNVEDAADEP
jgi:ribonuclease HI